MSREEIIKCDNPECQRGSHHHRTCKNKHDICNCCSKTLYQEEDEDEQDYCPICLEKAKLK